MLKKIYEELKVIREELQTIRSSMELKMDKEELSRRIQERLKEEWPIENYIPRKGA